VRFKLLLVYAVILVSACKSKPVVTPDDIHYVRTTLGLMRMRAQLQPADSNTINQRLDSVYHAFSTSKQAYANATSQLATNEKHAALVYQAIKDSLGVK
jgi:hypothetical protein